MDIGAILKGAAEDAGYDDDEFDQETASPLPIRQQQQQAGIEQKRDSLSILRASSDEVAHMDRQSSKDAFEKATKQVKLDVSIITGDIQGSLAQISESVNSDAEELARAGVASRRGDETASQMHRRNDDDDDDGAGSDDDDDDDDDRENSDPALDRELFVATFRGNARKVDKLLNTGARYQAKDMHGWTALHWAASEGHDDIMELLLDCAKRTSSPSKFKKILHCKDILSGWTALHVAAIKGQKVCIKLLINAGAKMSLKNHFSETPLECVDAESIADKKAIVKLLTKQ